MNIKSSQNKLKPDFKIVIFLIFCLAILSICLIITSFNKTQPIALLINSTYYENRFSPIEIVMKEMEIEFERYLTFKDEFPEQDSFSALIISGGNSMVNYFDERGNTLKGATLISQTSKPVLGICLGNQIIGRINGSYLESFEQQGWAKINIIEEDELLKNVPYTFNAWENHLFSLGEVPENFDVLCVGDENSIQMIKHQERPVYGVQFHPEFGDGKLENHAMTILKNFLNIYHKKSKWIL